MKIRNRKISNLIKVIFFLLFAVGTQPCLTETNKQSNIDEFMKKIEDYLNNLKTFEADFVQVDVYGRDSSGHFWLKRPYLMKMSYSQPSSHVLIAKDNKIMHYDRELKEKTITSMYSSPLSFFMESRINLRSNLKIVSIVDDCMECSVTFCKKDSDTEGAVRLVFSKAPFELLRWEIFSKKSQINTDDSTKIILLNRRNGHKIPNSIFDKIQ